MEDSDFLSVRDYGSGIWRWKWFIVAVVVAGALAGFLYASRQPDQYKATATLMYQNPVDPENPLVTTYVNPLVIEALLNSASGVLTSPEIREAAENDVGEVTASYEVSGEIATSESGGVASGSTNLLLLSVVSTNASESALLANAYATALTEWSREQQLARLEKAEQATKARMEGFTTEASRRSDEYLILRSQLLQLGMLKTTATGDFAVVVPATVPASPFSPKPLLSSVLGLAIGLILSLGVAMLAAQFTTRIRSREDAAKALGMPVLGVLPRVPGADGGKLLALEDRSGDYAEALRLLRTTLEYASAESTSSLLITSSVSGEGKSLFACNLAATLAMAGKHVILVDADLRRPRVHDYMSLPNNIGVTSIVTNACPLEDALQRVVIPSTVTVTVHGESREPAAGPSRLEVLTSGPSTLNAGDLIASERFKELMLSLATSPVDVLIVDSPPLATVGDAAAMASSVYAMVFVVDPRRVKRAELAAAKEILDSLPCRQLGVVLVGSKPKSPYHYNY